MPLTKEERLAGIDRRVDELKQGLVEAVELLRRAPEVNDAWGERWLDVSKRMRGCAPGSIPLTSANSAKPRWSPSGARRSRSAVCRLAGAS
jgi:hypothetical protein